VSGAWRYKRPEVLKCSPFKKDLSSLKAKRAAVDKNTSIIINSSFLN
jgi:hypothetical protein